MGEVGPEGKGTSKGDVMDPWGSPELSPAGELPEPIVATERRESAHPSCSRGGRGRWAFISPLASV